jgi:hypothetical protein
MCAAGSKITDQYSDIQHYFDQRFGGPNKAQNFCEKFQTTISGKIADEHLKK